MQVRPGRGPAEGLRHGLIAMLKREEVVFQGGERPGSSSEARMSDEDLQGRVAVLVGANPDRVRQALAQPPRLRILTPHDDDEA